MENNSNIKKNAINKDNDTRKIITMIVMICTLMLGTTGATYAYFAINATNNVATGTAAEVNLTLSVTQADLKNTTHTNVMVPQREGALANAISSANKCIDTNNNVICKVYTITVTNTGSTSISVNGTIQFSLSGTNVEMQNLKWKRATGTVTLGSITGGSYDGVAVDTIDTKADTTTIDALSTIFDLESGTECNIEGNVTTGCTSVSLAPTNGTKTYYIVIWINETTEAQTDSGTWRATIAFQGSNGSGVTSTITS